MRAAQLTRYGPPELLTVTEVAGPRPARYELADIAGALRAVHNRKTYGKVVIMMSDPANWEV
jgi:hypothetical protein